MRKIYFIGNALLSDGLQNPDQTIIIRDHAAANAPIPVKAVTARYREGRLIAVNGWVRLRDRQCATPWISRISEIKKWKLFPIFRIYVIIKI